MLKSATVAFLTVLALQSAWPAVNSQAPPCPNGQTLISNGTAWGCAAAGLSAFSTGDILLRRSGACPTGFAEITNTDGRMVRLTVTANADLGTTGGVDTITPAGTIAWPAGVPTNSGGAVNAHSGTAVADHASHTHTYTDVITHTHAVTSVGSAATGSTTNLTGASDTSSTTATAAAPAGAVATGTTAGPSATLTHAVTQPANHVFTQPTIAWPAGVPTLTGTQFDNRPQFVRWIACEKS